MAVRRPGFKPMNMQIRFGARESVRLLTKDAYLLGGAYEDDVLLGFFGLGEVERDEFSTRCLLSGEIGFDIEGVEDDRVDGFEGDVVEGWKEYCWRVV